MFHQWRRKKVETLIKKMAATYGNKQKTKLFFANILGLLISRKSFSRSKIKSEENYWKTYYSIGTFYSQEQLRSSCWVEPEKALHFSWLYIKKNTLGKILTLETKIPKGVLLANNIFRFDLYLIANFNF